jgi:hypothetical protein
MSRSKCRPKTGTFSQLRKQAVEAVFASADRRIRELRARLCDLHSRGDRGAEYQRLTAELRAADVGERFSPNDCL